MNGTKSWTWHMVAGLVLLFVLGLHMLILHMAGAGHWFAPNGAEPGSVENSLFRDGKLFFTVTYIVLLGVALYHGLYGLRTIVFELTLKPSTEKAITIALVFVGLGLFVLGTFAAVAAHHMALAATGG